MNVRVKICGLTNLRDAEFALESGADALGFVLEPSSPRALPESEWSLPQRLGPFTTTFAVYGPLRSPSPAGFSAIQYTEGSLPPNETRKSLRSIRIKEEDTLADVLQKLEGLDWALIEAHHPAGYGGMGHQLDWGFAAEIVAATQVQIVLAGGLKADNVAQAVNKVRPYGVDVSSGVEAQHGLKDHNLVKAFIEAAKGAL